jgi:uncharacterized damage-inducible protein DinB
MDLIAGLSGELAYNAWANQVTLRSLLAARVAPDRAEAVMGHIVGAEWLWLNRLGHPGPEMDVWPSLPPGEWPSRLDDLARAWKDYLHGLTPEELGREVTYTNSNGETWSNRVADVLRHVVLHSSYHRGQIASLLGRAGEAAAYTDYIEWVRRGHSGFPAAGVG